MAPTAPARPDPFAANADDPPMKLIEPLCAVFRRKLKSEGLKYTAERAQILDAIIRRDDIFQADQLMRALKDQGFRVSKATVYRTIKLLQEAGILQQVLFDAEQSHYQLAYARGPSGVVVETGGGPGSGKITPVDVPELEAIRDEICRKLGLTPHGHRFVIYATRE
jgi:Fur family ferric uptake transcriptional regulator